MRRAFLLLLPAVLLVLLAFSGCNDESNPKFSRIVVNPTCGVVPLQIDCLAIATGGNETGDPTGGNNNLEISWSFGDGGTGSTSLAYHTFTTPGTYTVTASASDPDGSTATISQEITVVADTLSIMASSNFPDGAVTTNDTISFDVRASACGIDPDIDDDYRTLFFQWRMNDDAETVLSNRRPRFRFDTAGTYAVELAVSYTALATTRWDTLVFEVMDP